MRTSGMLAGLAWLLAGVAFGAAPARAAAEPSDNPVAAYYSGDEGYPAWTDTIKWTQVVNLKEYANGASDFEKFERARDELAAKGGGILYYPAGVYDFSTAPLDGPGGRGLMLKSGVVIRGQAPAGKPNAAQDGKLELPTRFTFGFNQGKDGEYPHDWAVVGLRAERGRGLKEINNVGIAWVHLEGAIVWFGFDTDWGRTWASAGCFKSSQAKGEWGARVPDGTHFMDPLVGGGKKYLGMGRGRLVFGCVLENAAPVNTYRNGAVHTERFASRLGVYGSRVLVANNLLPKPTKCFRYGEDLFDYAKTCGIDVDKDSLGWVRDNGKCAGYFEPGVVVRDNWVWNHGHKGYSVAGSWVTLAHNHNERKFLKSGDDVYGLGGGWTLTLDGAKKAGPASDNLARAFDLGGRNLWIDSNTFNNSGSTPGNDGEGILCQLHGGTHVYSWAITRNRYDMQGGQPSYMGGYDVNCLGLLIAWNDIPSGWVGIKAKPANQLADLAFFANQAKTVKSPTPLPDGQAPRAPVEVKAELFAPDAVKITWQDASDNEGGFRVDRRIEDGKWTPIAYRPPQIEKHKENPPAWVDFLAPPGRKLTYRVVAIGVEDKDDGASGPAAPVTLPRP